MTLQDLQPRAFLLERPRFAYGVHRDALDYVVSSAEEIGYNCHMAGAQRRGLWSPSNQRALLLLVGVLDRSFVFPEPTHSKAPGASLFDGGLRPWTTAGEAIGDLDTEESADDSGHFAGGQYHDILKRFRQSNYLYLRGERGHPEPVFEWRSRYWSFLLKLSPDLPSWTIQARRSNNMGPFHWRNRILRIEEIKRLQSFPDDWHLAGKIEDQWRQVGNAVPPLLVEAIGDAIADHLKERRLSA